MKKKLKSSLAVISLLGILTSLFLTTDVFAQDPPEELQPGECPGEKNYDEFRFSFGPQEACWCLYDYQDCCVC